MKSLRLLTVLAIACIVSLLGCSTWKAGTYKTTGTVVVTADTAMQLWGRYVATGQATEKQQDAVRAAYGKYQAAMTAVIDTAQAATTSDAQTALETVVAAATAAQANLGQIINAFLPVERKMTLP